MRCLAAGMALYVKHTLNRMICFILLHAMLTSQAGMVRFIHGLNRLGFRFLNGRGRGSQRDVGHIDLVRAIASES